MKRSIFIISFIVFSVLTLYSFVSFAGADTNCPTGAVCLTDPLNLPKEQPIPTLLGGIIKYAMGIIGSLALVMFIFGGATWMLSGGNQERVAKGKQIIIWAALGIVIIFTAYALVKFLIDTMGEAGG